MENPWRMLTPREAAKQLGVSDQAVRRYYRSGILKGHNYGRYLLIDQRAVLALIKVIDQAKNGNPLTPLQRKARAASLEANGDQANGIALYESADEGKAI